MQQSWGGEVLRTSYRQLVGDGTLPAGRPVGERVAVALAETEREAIFAELAGHEAVLLQDAQVRSCLDQVSRASATLERARLRLACEAAERGLYSMDGFTLV